MSATLSSLVDTGVSVTPEHRIRGISALIAFNSLPFDQALALEKTLAGAHSNATLYVLACKRIMFNLASNPALLLIPVHELVALSDEHMARGTIVERVQQQEKARHEAYVNMLQEKQNAVEQKTESVIHCRKCESANLNFCQVQLRSADEPMTVFLTCNACGHRWRMS